MAGNVFLGTHGSQWVIILLSHISACLIRSRVHGSPAMSCAAAGVERFNGDMKAPSQEYERTPLSTLPWCVVAWAAS